MGIASMILGILSISMSWIPLVNFFFVVPALVGLALGIASVRQIQSNRRGVAKAGIILSSIALLVIALPYISAIAQPNMAPIEQAACRANMVTLLHVEQEYFQESGRYTEDFDELGLGGLKCPFCRMPYEIDIVWPAEENGISIHCPSNPSHGDIENGQPSWEE